MRLQRPQLPAADTSDKFGTDLVFKLKQILTAIVDQVNQTNEGQVSAVTNATTSAPTTGTYQQGDFVRNNTPTVLGAAGSHYIVTGWTCTVASTPTTPAVFVQARALTGT